MHADDIDRLMAGGHAYAEREGRTLIHLNRVGFRVDGAAGVHDPRGMAARKPFRRPAHRDRRRGTAAQPACWWSSAATSTVRALIATPYASALAATSEEERRLGVTCIDIGGGTTTVAAFSEGHFSTPRPSRSADTTSRWISPRPCRHHLPRLSKSRRYTARMVVAQSDEHEAFSYALAGEEDGARGQATKAQLAGIIRPRVAGILGMVRERLDKAGVTAFAGERVVLTGGASGLVGLGEFAANTLGRPVRVSAPPAGRRGCRKVFAVRVFDRRRAAYCGRCVGKRTRFRECGDREALRGGILRARRGVAEDWLC